MRIGGNTGGGKTFAKPQPGQHVAVCAAVYDIGVQTREWQGEEKIGQEVAVIWELAEQDPEGGPFTMVDSVKNSMHKKSKLFAIVKALADGKVLEHQELDTEDIVGKCAVLTLEESDKGSVYVDSRSRLQPGVKGIEVQGGYGPDDELHGLVAWHMGRAKKGTVPTGQGAARKAKEPEDDDDEPEAVADEKMPF